MPTDSANNSAFLAFLEVWFNSLPPSVQASYLTNAEFMRRIGHNIPSKALKHQFITIALPQTTNLPQLVSTIHSLNYSYLSDAMLTIENFSGELHTENLHIHILKKEIYSKNKIIRDLSKKFKVSNNFINIKLGKTEKDYMNRLHYINGEKQSEIKTQNSKMDKQWRTDNDLEQIYYL